MAAKLKAKVEKELDEETNDNEDTNDDAELGERADALEADVAAIKDDVAAIKGSGEEVEKGIKRLEQKLGRPAIIRNAPKPVEVEKKAFASYLRLGNGTPAEELKTLNVSSDPQGGYLAPAEMSTSSSATWSSSRPSALSPASAPRARPPSRIRSAPASPTPSGRARCRRRKARSRRSGRPKSS